MSTVTLIWVASLGGALLFFFSGFLLSRRLDLSTVADDLDYSSQKSEQQMAAMREQLRQIKLRESEANRALGRLRDDNKELVQKLEEGESKLKLARNQLEQALGTRRSTLAQFGEDENTGDRVAQLKDALDEALTRRKEAEQKAETFKDRLDLSSEETRALEDRCATLEDEMQALRGTGRASASRLTQPQWRADGADEELAGMVEGLKGEVETLTAAMKNLRQQYEDAERRNDELRLQLHSKEREIKEAQAVNQELVRLRKEVEEAEHARRVLRKRLEDAPGGTHYLHQDTEVNALQQQIEQLNHQLDILRTENESLRDLAEGTEDTGRRRRSRSDTRPMKALSGDIQEQMETYMTAEATLGIVLSDDNGLPVMSHGEHIDEIAAVAAHVTKLSSTTAKLLPMGALARLTMEDVEERTVTIFPVANEELMLALLSDGAPPDETGLAEVLAHAEAMI